jgi:uncharacterized protein (DUF697 family)
MVRKTKNQVLKNKLAASLDASSSSNTAARSGPVVTSSVKAESTHFPYKNMNESTDTITLHSNVNTANRVVMTSAMLAMGAGAVPFPGWDMAAIAGVHLKMLADLSKIYDVDFSENLGKSTIATLVATVAPAMLAKSSFASVIKAIPGIGQLVGVIAIPAYAGIFTYAIGRIFIAHFESGGDLLTFSPKEFSSHFAEEVKAGIKKVVSIKL